MTVEATVTNTLLRKYRPKSLLVQRIDEVVEGRVLGDQLAADLQDVGMRLERSADHERERRQHDDGEPDRDPEGEPTPDPGQAEVDDPSRRLLAPREPELDEAHENDRAARRNDSAAP